MTWVVFGHALFIPLTTRTVSNSLEVGSKWPLNFMTQVRFFKKNFFLDFSSDNHWWNVFCGFIFLHFWCLTILSFCETKLYLERPSGSSSIIFSNSFKNVYSKNLDLIFLFLRYVEVIKDDVCLSFHTSNTSSLNDRFFLCNNFA